jgi:hypothetical protein
MRQMFILGISLLVANVLFVKLEVQLSFQEFNQDKCQIISTPHGCESLVTYNNTAIASCFNKITQWYLNVDTSTNIGGLYKIMDEKLELLEIRNKLSMQDMKYFLGKSVYGW